MTNPRRVLIVTGAEDLNVPQLSKELETAGFDVSCTEDGRAARQHIERNGLPHLMIVDLHLPDMEGVRLCQEMADKAGLPILTVSSDVEGSSNAVEALRYADDYVRRSYADPEEITMRVRRILSRIENYSYAKGPEIAIYDWLSVDHVNRQVTVHGEVRKLTPTENALLHVLLSHRGKVVDAEILIERVWRLDPSIKDKNALRVHIHRLRNKIEDDPDNPRIIRTERGTGYSFAEA